MNTQTKEFVDYYELMELSPNANSPTIERVFRYLAKKHHPDVAGESNVNFFAQLIEAYETLRNPEARAAYDVEFERQKQLNRELVQGADSAADDSLERYRLLTIFYSQRRRDYKNPGIGVGTLEQLASCPPEILEFHLWYFREKGWIDREESGQLAITAVGVDRVESMNENYVSSQLLLEHKPTTLPTPKQPVLT